MFPGWAVVLVLLLLLLLLFLLVRKEVMASFWFGCVVCWLVVHSKMILMDCGDGIGGADWDRF